MKRLILFIFCLYLPISWAQSPVWKIETDNSSLYLAGTIHVLRASDYPLPPAFEQAYAQSELLAFETDIMASQSPEFSRQVMRLMMLPVDTSLQQLLEPNTLERLQNYLNANQMSLDQFARMKPAMVAITLVLQELIKLGAGTHGVDQFYFVKAMGDGKKIHALETSQQQLEFLSRMGEGQENLLIEQTLDDIQQLQQLFNDMVSSWRKGDRKQLKTLFVDPMRQDFAPIYQQLLVQRNHNWLPQIISMLTTPDTELVLVGSAHLLGPDGLLQLLQQQGYRITQLD
ncbi:MAG: TraB/GumN family protein [Gammaproteobacteria bacterium]|nr:TraB/GumN family protein [Gammaproteobacteria bacterium]